MKHQLTPRDLTEDEEFKLLAVVDHLHIKQFITEQIANEKQLTRQYSVYQIAMIALFLLLLTKAIFSSAHGINQPLWAIGASVLFSFSLLIILHELIHAAAYRLVGTGKVQFGAIWQKFIFYAAVDQEVIDYRSFRMVALAPFVFVKVASITLVLILWSSSWAYFFASLMCIHSLFCSGDMAMLAFYKLHPDKEIYNFDDLSRKKSFFYFKKKSNS